MPKVKLRNRNTARNWEIQRDEYYNWNTAFGLTLVIWCNQFICIHVSVLYRYYINVCWNVIFPLKFHRKQFHYTNGLSFLANQSVEKEKNKVKHLHEVNPTKKMGRFVFILTFIVNKCRLCSVALRTQSLAKLLRKCFTRRIVYTENPDSHLYKKWAKTKAVESTSNCQKKRQIRMDKWTQGTQCCLFLVAYK